MIPGSILTRGDSKVFLRLRQLCLVAHDLEPVVDDLKAVFDIDVCHRDPAVAKYGLHNALLPIGNSFVEIVAPTQDKTAAGRYLDRRKGDPRGSRHFQVR